MSTHRTWIPSLLLISLLLTACVASQWSISSESITKLRYGMTLQDVQAQLGNKFPVTNVEFLLGKQGHVYQVYDAEGTYLAYGLLYIDGVLTSVTKVDKRKRLEYKKCICVAMQDEINTTTCFSGFREQLLISKLVLNAQTQDKEDLVLQKQHSLDTIGAYAELATISALFFPASAILVPAYAIEHSALESELRETPDLKLGMSYEQLTVKVGGLIDEIALNKSANTLFFSSEYFKPSKLAGFERGILQWVEHRPSAVCRTCGSGKLCNCTIYSYCP